MDTEQQLRQARQQQQTLRLLAQLVEIAPNKGMTRRVQKLFRTNQLSIPEILDRIAGDSIIQKAKVLGTKRQTIYAWIALGYRPSPKLAKRIAKITGLDYYDIRGRSPSDPAA